MQRSIRTNGHGRRAESSEPGDSLSNELELDPSPCPEQARLLNKTIEFNVVPWSERSRHHLGHPDNLLIDVAFRLNRVVRLI